MRYFPVIVGAYKCIGLSLLLLFSLPLNALENVLVWTEAADSETVRALTSGASKNYSLIGGEKLRAAIKNNRCEKGGNFCSRNIAFEFSSSIIVSATPLSNAPSSDITLEVKNVVSGESLEKIIKPCGDCSSEQKIQWSKNVALQTTIMLDALVEQVTPSKPVFTSVSSVSTDQDKIKLNKAVSPEIGMPANALAVTLSATISTPTPSVSTNKLKSLWKEYKKIVTKYQRLADRKHYKSVKMNLGDRSHLDQLVEDISKGLMQRYPKTTVVFYGLPISTTAARDATQKSRKWKYGSDHWSIANDTNLFIAWRHDTSYFYVVIDHKRSKDGFQTSMKAGDKLFQQMN